MMTNSNTALRKPAKLWRNINFTLMWTSTAASGFGDRMIMLAGLALLGGLVAGTHNSTSVQASTQFWFFLPYIIFSMPAGWIADRLPRKWLLLACDEFRGIILLLSFFAVAAATGVSALPQEYHWRVYLALFGVGTCAAVFNTTRNAIIPQIVSSQQLQPGNAIIIGINMVAALIGMKVGAAIIHPQHASSVRLGLIIAACFYFVSGTFFAFMRIKNGHYRFAAEELAVRRNSKSMRVAIEYVLVHKRMISLMALNILVWIIAAVVTSAILGVGKMLYGLQGHPLENYFASMYVAVGAGMLIGAIVVGTLRERRESLILTYIALAGAGLCVLLMAIVPMRALGFLFAFGIGFLGNVVIVSIMTLLQTMAPNYIRGRVMGINALGIAVFSVLAYFIVWQTPRADINITLSLYGIGPLLVVVGTVGLMRYLKSGHVEVTGNVLWRLTRLFVFIWHRLDWQGRHNIPATGPVILASNHTAALDPLLIQAVCPRVVRWVMLSSYKFRILNLAWKVVKPLCLDRAAGDTGKIRAIARELEKGAIVGMFPEGGLQDGKRELGQFSNGVAMIAKRSGAVVVPVWVKGTPRRKSMILQLICPSHSKVTFGKPYRPDVNASNQEVMDDLRRRMEMIGN